MASLREPAVKIQLFGPFAVWRAGQPIEAWPQEKTKSLLKILAGQPGRVFQHDELIESLWLEADPVRAKRTLKSRITELRRLLEPGLKQGRDSRFIETHHEGYRFNPGADCLVDLREFTRLAEEGKALEQAGSYEQAVAAYQGALRWCEPGELLAADVYEPWAQSNRRSWEQDYLDALSRLAECQARLGRYRRALARCRLILQKEPYRESSWRQLMLYYYLAGSPSEALSAYESCCQKFKELKREPSRQTQKLYEQIKVGRIPGIDKLYRPPPVVRHEIPYTLSPGSIPFVGRQAEYARLVGHLEQARQGEGRCVLISGEAGVGKTGLIQEIITHAAQPLQAHIFSGRCPELIQLAYQPWAEAVREGLNTLKLPALKAIPSLWLAEVAQLAPELRTRMPELPENPPLPPQQQQLRLFEGLVQFFVGLVQPESTPKPLIVVLEDLHWADPTSLDLLSYLLPRLERTPILVLGSYRSEEVGEGHRLWRHLRAWKSENLVHRLSLPRLALPETAELLRRLPLAVKRPDSFCGRLHKETEGNPLFLVTTLQHLFEEGALRLEGDAWVTDIEDISANYRELPIPPTIRDLLKRRLGRLSESPRRMLQLASVIGRDFESALLERAWERSAEFFTALVGLTKAQLLMERQGRCEFNHDKIRQLVYEEIPPPVRRLLHQRVLHALEQLYSGRLEEGAALLAHHAYRAGKWKKALEYVVRALKQAVAEYRQEEGLELAELGWEATEKLEAAGEDRAHVDRQRFELLSLRVAIYNWQGRRAEQERDLARMQRLADQLSDKSKLALVFQKRGKLLLQRDFCHKPSSLFRVRFRWDR